MQLVQLGLIRLANRFYYNTIASNYMWSNQSIPRSLFYHIKAQNLGQKALLVPVADTTTLAVIWRIFWDCFRFRLTSWSRTASGTISDDGDHYSRLPMGWVIFHYSGTSFALRHALNVAGQEDRWNLITISETDLTLVQETKGYVCAPARLSIQFS